MNWVVILPFVAVSSAFTLPLGIAAQLGVMILVFATFLSGRLISNVVHLDEPYLEFVAGFALISHFLVACDILAPGQVWPIVIALLLLCFVAIATYVPARQTASLLGVALFAAAFTYVWCWDLASRLNQFQQSGRLEFWIDIIVHAGTISQFSASNSIGRGMELMADAPRALYHVASYMQPALVARVLQIPAIETSVLIWIPFGILIMVAGVLSLGLALGGVRLAVTALAAIALLPNPEQFTLQNGLLGFAWLLETAPGTPYSLGVSCSAIAALIYWIRDRRLPLLGLAIGLTAACFFVRVNTFIWLAPAIAIMALSAISSSPIGRRSIQMVGLAVFCAFLIFISWEHISADPAGFLFSYVDSANQGVHPAYYAQGYSWIHAAMGRPVASGIGVVLVLLGTLGPWLAVFIVSALLTSVRGKFERFDAIPFIILAVAAIVMILGPIPPNGDGSEFRHRAGPLLVVIILVWSLRFAALAGERFLPRVKAQFWSVLLVIVSAVSIATMMVNVASARQPKLNWSNYYDQQFSPLVFQAASVLGKREGGLPRFVVADQTRDTRNIDTAAMLVALSGIPAYISCPQSLLMRNDPIGKEAQRRMLVVDALKAAPTLDVLNDIMRLENITYYVVTSRDQARFDPERKGAMWRSGSYAIYSNH